MQLSYNITEQIGGTAEGRVHSLLDIYEDNEWSW